MEAAVVVNPASANGKTGRRWPKLATVMEKEGFSFVHQFTEGPGHATEITRNFLQIGHDLIISVGGDGTTNEVVNGFFVDGKLIRDSAALAFINAGTGGDLRRTIGIPGDDLGAIRHILHSPLRAIDIGKIIFTNDQNVQEARYFVNIAGLGLDGDTVARVNRTTKVFGGFASFLWGTVASLLLYRNQNMVVVVDGVEICDEPLTAAVIGNGSYFGGGMFIAPNAVIDDGFFDIIILRNLSKIKQLVNLPRIYSGTHLTHPQVTSLRGKKINVSSSGNALLNLDGEQPGRAPVEIELLPLAIKIKG
ncbi:MAG TPA: diacylglycerol kinase family protein [Candidatus Limnocylindrales bacterium]|nr:diacylglycerol kinase family protein [Candidatus Limnocylindrales bacterium]